MFNLYHNDERDRARFVLGVRGRRNLIVVGLNPSTATRDKSDITASKVRTVAATNGYDGFAIINLYPRRATDPAQLPQRKYTPLFEQNIDWIASLIAREEKPQLWAAWGGDITRRNYLKEAFVRIDRLLTQHNGQWLHYGSLRKDGHPRHPSRLSYRWQFSPFDAQSYAQLI